MNRWLLNFDVRVSKEQYVAMDWPKELRVEFLLRPEIIWTLSVDKRVWPSVFWHTTHREPLLSKYPTIDVNPHVDGYDWLNLDRMRAHYDAHRALAPGGVFVGIELLSEQAAEGEMLYESPVGIQCGITLDPTVPACPPAGSTLLGYDVADPGRTSGLTNCGYTEEEHRTLAPVWGPRLNSFGLFSSLDDAAAFRQICNDRVPEHAPFWVYALWRLPFLITSAGLPLH